VDPAALLESARELRAALRRVAAAVAEGGDGTFVEAADLGVVNGILQAGHPVVSVDPGGMFRPMLAPHGAGPEAALLPIAHSALDLLTGKDPARLHRCANERCVLLFYDTTKSATRRWCSVGCMNRARSAARHRARKRQSGDGALGAPRGAPPVL
jgi:predicted RNA-binding Zn ribbon-like protein